MKRLLLPLFLLVFSMVRGQTPVSMAAQSNYTFTETFADVANWTFNTSNDGSFSAGTGATAWKGIVNGGTGTIPTAANVTTRTTSFSTGVSGGVQKGTQALVLLATGSTDNSASAAIDFFLNFSGVNAGVLSFDWASVNNSTGDRKGSLKVYISIDGVNFSSLAAADVLNITNNATTSGSIINVALPASLNNVSTARLRFYYYNGTGGTTGSRPKVSIDNIKVTAVSAVACTTPAANPTALNFSSIANTSVSAAFTAPTVAPHNYIVLQSNYAILSDVPQNGTTYSIGDNIGDATVISLASATSFTATALVPQTTYYFYIFSVNNLCTGGPLYQTSNPLSGSITTLAGVSNCIAPAAQATALTFSGISSNSLQGSFTAASGADEYLVIRTSTTTLSANPVNGTAYNTGDVLGNGVVVSRGAANTFTSSGLSVGTTYYYTLFALNAFNCNSGPTYNISSPLKGNATTAALQACGVPAAQPTALSVVPNNTSVSGSFTPSGTADSYLVLFSSSATLSASPANGTVYAAGNAIGNATVVSMSTATAFVASGLTSSTRYYFYVFGANNVCTGGIRYLTASPLTGTVTTTATAQYNYYFGNLHAHSYYSDGNKDQPTATPATDYAYARNSLCLDFLGISEHNHAGAGMALSKWQPGLSQAAAATTSNFLALYGMEWGVISGGGHVIVYGQDKLMGWETNNYDVFVQKSDYTGTPSTTGTNGLFRTINTSSPNAFATLAHPSSTDFNNLGGVAYNAVADSAIVGVALQSGPAFSTNTTYTDPSSMSYLSYYTRLLAKGYKVGPTIDHDNHNTTFGRTTYARLAVIAPALDTGSFYKAMKGMHFYATEDCDTKVMLTVNNQLMGYSIASANPPAIYINAIDPTSALATPVIKLMYGVPGSGISPVQLASVSGNTLTFTDNNLATNATAYYYADITINGARTITSPVWFTKSAATFYCKAAGSLSETETWGTNADGSGTMPADFSTGTFILANRPAYALNADASFGGVLNIPAGATLNLNGFTLTISMLTGSGSLQGASTSNLIVAGANGSAGTINFSASGSSLNNLIINRTGSSAAVTLGTPLDLFGVLTLANGNLIANGFLTLKSNATTTARVAPVTNGTITGNVTVERFVANVGHRAWRLASASVNSTQSVFQAWQDSGYNRAGVGTQITSNLYNGSNGFDAVSNSPSMLSHAQGGSAGASWVPLTNTNVTSINSKPGFLVYVRGDRSATPQNSVVSATTLRAIGALRTGTQPAVTISSVGTGYTLVCNPFASPIDVETFANTPRLNQSFYLWDPTIAGSYGLGAFRVVTRFGPNDYQATPTAAGEQTYRYIQSGGCLFLKAFGGDASLVLGENNKATQTPAPLILKATNVQPSLRINLVASGKDSVVLDGVRILFSDHFNDAVTEEDAFKMDNFGETIAIRKQDTMLVMEQRKLPADDTIHLHVSKLLPKAYTLSVAADNIGTSSTVFFHDRFTGINIPLNVVGLNNYSFVVTDNIYSNATDRFFLTWKTEITQAESAVTLRAYKHGAQVNLQWNRPSALCNMVELERTTDGLTFQPLAVVTSSLQYTDITSANGTRYYRLRMVHGDGRIAYSNTVAVDPSLHGTPEKVVASLASGMMQLNLLHQPRGLYTYALINETGQGLLKGSLFHEESDARHGVTVAALPKGIYFLQLTFPDQRIVTRKVINL